MVKTKWLFMLYFSAGNSAIYTCDPDYDLVGPSERVRGNDGEWSGVAPMCIRKSDDYCCNVIIQYAIFSLVDTCLYY